MSDGKSLVLGFAYGLVKVSRGVRKGALVVVTGFASEEQFINTSTDDDLKRRLKAAPTLMVDAESRTRCRLNGC